MSNNDLIFETVTRNIDFETGELVEEERKRILRKKNIPEPNFIKIYLDCMLSFTGVKHIPSDFLMQLCKYVTYANNKGKQMYVKISKMERDEIASELGISDSMVKRHIRNCIDSGILFKSKYRASFIVNPFLIAKGEWANIKELRAEFNFTSGTWTYIKGTDYVE